MRRNFLELRRFLLQNYPHVFSEENISGGTQPPPSNAMYFAQVTGTLQLIAVAFAFFWGQSLEYRTHLGRPSASVVGHCTGEQGGGHVLSLLR
mmetsp:Transcript_32181/g.74065  ORF Transcript_32181/g.74065 Transcript_32181/m.74065 type:complete len:93 (+) Transcript_32181:468-746(+)